MVELDGVIVCQKKVASIASFHLGKKMADQSKISDLRVTYLGKGLWSVIGVSATVVAGTWFSPVEIPISVWISPLHAVAVLAIVLQFY